MPASPCAPTPPAVQEVERDARLGKYARQVQLAFSRGEDTRAPASVASKLPVIRRIRAARRPLGAEVDELGARREARRRLRLAAPLHARSASRPRGLTSARSLRDRSGSGSEAASRASGSSSIAAAASVPPASLPWSR
jgi:hypothetical protein